MLGMGSTAAPNTPVARAVATASFRASMMFSLKVGDRRCNPHDSSGIRPFGHFKVVRLARNVGECHKSLSDMPASGVRFNGNFSCDATLWLPFDDDFERQRLAGCLFAGKNAACPPNGLPARRYQVMEKSKSIASPTTTQA